MGIAAYVATRPGVADRLVAHRHKGPLPVDDPELGNVARPRPVRAPLLMQQVARRNLELAIELWVRALHNGTDVAFHIEWATRS
ncbi:MAG: hypothetical protein U0360_07450 [Dehalococcoidia bacterium]